MLDNHVARIMEDVRKTKLETGLFKFSPSRQQSLLMFFSRYELVTTVCIDGLYNYSIQCFALRLLQVPK